MCEFCGEIVKDDISVMKHIWENHQHVDGDCEDSNGRDTDCSCGHNMEDEEEVVEQDEEGMGVIHVNSSSNTSPKAEMQEINN